jgi:hypothetical protein
MSTDNYYCKFLFIFREYVVWRLGELEISKFENYKNDCGGNFKNELWFSAFPTDSQVNSIYKSS